ncbi:methionine--tRNA ligase [Helicobacter ibis]|uniref:Methionine--tRNA ligase n=1 Tax=Helicobacter ibis TaxID=2962633 RepID=A0ABT4VBI1_9HELI|nr:methionine--tRNA ligase [Helicobacter ibis]MDA3968062.1 methionine--tRNA ligase [Helicobacter ibis]
MEVVLNSKFYVTTPIYYVNDKPHIGHAYTTIISDTLARYHSLCGDEVFFLTGTDEHGQKIEQSAKKNNENPSEYVDKVASKFKDMWDSFNISYDKFIRTSEVEHKNSVKNAFIKMFNKGDIYKGEYEGNYCISCESFVMNAILCPDCGKELVKLKEESYFFKLSAYEDRLLKFYDENPNFILPTYRKKEVINFIKNGLEDLSITRTSFKWGVEIPNEVAQMSDKEHVVYVWLDALMNYLSALGYENNLESKMEFFPPDIQLVGKDILKFHAIYWPAFLMSLDLPLPKHIAAHGWWTKDGAKMSKSIGNVVNPSEVVSEFGLDVFRYFLLREVPFGQDGDFSQRAIVERSNADLSNVLGNLLNRLLGMGEKYFDNNLDSLSFASAYEVELKEVEDSINIAREYIFKVELHNYLESIWRIFDLANLTITKKEPWKLIKENKYNEVAELLVFISNTLIKGAYMLYPCMPASAKKILSVFSLGDDGFGRFVVNKEILTSVKLNHIPPLFPRLEVKEEIKQEIKSEAKLEPLSIENVIDRDYFMNIDIKVGTIIEVEVLPKSEKLLKLRVDLGETRPRQIIAGIKLYYEPQELIGMQVCVLANLKPAKLMGEISEGMILAVKDDSGLSVITPHKVAQNGSKIS